MSTDYSITGDKVIKKALQKLGVIAIGETIPSDDLTDCRDTLNILIKNMMAQQNSILKGMKTWQRERKSLTLSAKAKYEIKESGGDLDSDIPVKMIDVRLKDTDDNETPLTQIQLSEYERIGNKSQVSTPSKWFYERHIDSGFLYFDTIPSDITDVAELTFLRTLNDVDKATDVIEFPSEYYRVLVYALAIDLAPEYGQEITTAIMSGAESSIKLANSMEPEEINAYFQPGLDY